MGCFGRYNSNPAGRDEWSSASGDGHPAGECWDRGNSGSSLTEEAETGGNNQQILFENHGIDARYTGPHEVAPTMSARYGTGGNNVHWSQICRRVIVLPEISLIGKYKMEEMVWDASRIFPILLLVQTVMQCSAAKEVMNFCKIG